jgi:hypothetical protein
MRTLPLSLVGTVILGLLGGWGAVVAAQGEDGADSPAITPLTGTVIESLFDDSDEEYWVDGDGVGHARGARLEETFRWDDDRLPPVRRSVLHFDMYPSKGTGQVWVSSSTIRQDGPDGYWTGTGQWFGPVDSTPEGAAVYVGGQSVLVGHGAYEGLVAVMGHDVATASGYILEGQLPPMPEPVGPPTATE